MVSEGEVFGSYDVPDEEMFLSDDTAVAISAETDEVGELQALTIEDFKLGEFTAIGFSVGGTALVISLLVLGILSILRTR